MKTIQITEEKLKDALQIVLGSKGIYTERFERELVEQIIAFDMHIVNRSNDLISKKDLLEQIETSKNYYINEVNRFDYDAGFDKALYLIRQANEVERVITD